MAEFAFAEAGKDAVGDGVQEGPRYDDLTNACKAWDSRAHMLLVWRPDAESPWRTVTFDMYCQMATHQPDFCRRCNDPEYKDSPPSFHDPVEGWCRCLCHDPARSVSPDYRALLVKYIDHVGRCEGVDFLTDRCHAASAVSWTDEEWSTLQELRELEPPA
jgi:hypothetical protein